MDPSTKCPECNDVGSGKNRCLHGHTHCRTCPGDGNCWDGESAETQVDHYGSTWEVYCEEHNGIVHVRAIEELKIRDAPAAFKVPTGMFRTKRHMITLTVGQGRISETFLVEEPLLVAASPYFAKALKALKATFKEGQNGLVELAEKEPEVFGLLNEYLHLGTIEESCISAKMMSYGRLWLLAHCLQINQALNYSIWRLLTLVDKVESLEPMIIEFLYEKAPMESILRRFVVQLCVWGGKTELQPTGNAPQEMLLDLVKDFQRKCDGKERSPLMDVRNYYAGEYAVLQATETDSDSDLDFKWWKRHLTRVLAVVSI